MSSRKSRTAHKIHAGPKVVLLVDALLVNGGTIKPGRQKAEIDRPGGSFLFLLRLRRTGRICGERARTQQRQKDASQ